MSPWSPCSASPREAIAGVPASGVVRRRRPEKIHAAARSSHSPICHCDFLLLRLIPGTDAGDPDWNGIENLLGEAVIVVFRGAERCHQIRLRAPVLSLLR